MINEKKFTKVKKGMARRKVVYKMKERYKFSIARYVIEKLIVITIALVVITLILDDITTISNVLGASAGVISSEIITYLIGYHDVKRSIELEDW